MILLVGWIQQAVTQSDSSSVQVFFFSLPFLHRGSGHHRLRRAHDNGAVSDGHHRPHPAEHSWPHHQCSHAGWGYEILPDNVFSQIQDLRPDVNMSALETSADTKEANPRLISIGDHHKVISFFFCPQVASSWRRLSQTVAPRRWSSAATPWSPSGTTVCVSWFGSAIWGRAWLSAQLSGYRFTWIIPTLTLTLTKLEYNLFFVLFFIFYFCIILYHF